MGTLVCSRCKAKTEADSIEDGRKKLNHAIGLYIGKPCYDGKAQLFFTGTKKAKTISKTTSKKTLKKMIDKKPAESKSD